MSKASDTAELLPDSASLSALLAHELNNIAMPLQGFVDLAGNDLANADAIQRCLAELRIGITRISSLSLELECLAASSAPAAPIAVGACTGGKAYEIQFDCRPETAVSTNPALARQAIDALSRVGVAPRLKLSKHEGSQSLCSACGHLLNAKNGYIGIQLGAPRLPAPDVWKAPFAARHKLRASRRLTIAALISVAHRANGHLLASESADSVSLLLPAA